MSAPLILIGGWGLTPAIWAPLLAALGERIDTRALALPGHDSTGVQPAATLDGWVDAICAQLPKTTVVCASSLGTLIAMRLALRDPERITKLVLIGASPCPVAHGDWRDALDATHMARLRDDFLDTPAQAQARFITRYAEGDVRQPDVARVLDAARVGITDANRAPLADGLAILASTDLRTELEELACPVRLLHGANDAIVPEGAARWMAAAIPDARLSTFDDAGHLPTVSRPAHCAALIRAFIDE